MKPDSTCGIEYIVNEDISDDGEQLPRHMKSEDGYQMCYDSRECSFKFRVGYGGPNKKDLCLWVPEDYLGTQTKKGFE